MKVSARNVDDPVQDSMDNWLRGMEVLVRIVFGNLSEPVAVELLNGRDTLIFQLHELTYVEECFGWFIRATVMS